MRELQSYMTLNLDRMTPQTFKRLARLMSQVADKMPEGIPARIEIESDLPMVDENGKLEDLGAINILFQQGNKTVLAGRDV